MLDWIIWNWTVFDIETILKLKLTLNWIVLNGTDYLHKHGFGVK